MGNLSKIYDRISREVPDLELRRNEPMSRHTTFRVGGPAALMALPADAQQLLAAANIAREEGVTPLFVGMGSNLLVADEGLNAFVIKTAPRMSGCRVEGSSITALAGTPLFQIANAAADHGLTGLEFAHGIPGSLGGAITMNAGAYGGEMKQVVRSVRALNERGGMEELSAQDCDFSYRHSLFSDGRRTVIVATMELQSGDEGQIRATMAELMAKRREKQPLEWPSAGSTFKRPEGNFAAALIDQCGLKGLRCGGAQVSEKHAGFVINAGGATCADILALMEEVRQRVLHETGVELEAEVKYLR
ncbi:MAG: UDP-N-acetylmuramate dehydrogenase [Oscillospiraceae bacterium]|nr:UDP-N-acetylmuramate dehydrogenase [Oscillospiraceae bacterium]